MNIFKFIRTQINPEVKTLNQSDLDLMGDAAELILTKHVDSLTSDQQKAVGKVYERLTGKFFNDTCSTCKNTATALVREGVLALKTIRAKQKMIPPKPIEDEKK